MTHTVSSFQSSEDVEVSKEFEGETVTRDEPIYVSDETAGTPSTSHSVDNDIEKLGSFEHTTISQPSPKQGSISDDVKRTKPRNFLGNVLENIKGDGSKSPPRVSLVSTVLSGLFSFIGIFSVSFISHHGGAETLVIASFGASAVLIYDSIQSPLAQPRNVVGGQIVSAFVGVSVFKLFNAWGSDSFYEPAASASAVAIAVVCMDLTKTLHPPGGATALIAVIGGSSVTDLGYLYVVYPVGMGVIIMLSIAILLNNLVGTRSYPTFWW